MVIGGVALAALIITIITALLILNSFGGVRHDAVAVANGITVATFATVPGDNAYPTGMARGSDGSLYLSAFGTDIIYKLAADGKLTPWLQSTSGLTAPAALVSAPDGSLYVIDFSTSRPGSAQGSIKHISPDGTVTLFAAATNDQGLSFLSHLALDDQGNIYATSTATGEIWRYPAKGQSGSWLRLKGTTSTVIGAANSTAAQPTGLVYDAPNHALIVADGGTGTIYRLVIKADGSADTPSIIYQQNGLLVQGVTLDGTGGLLVVDWLHDNGQLARISADGKFTLLAQSFRAPSDVLLANGKIYVVNSDLQGLIPPLRAKPPFTVDVVTGS